MQGPAGTILMSVFLLMLNCQYIQTDTELKENLLASRRTYKQIVYCKNSVIILIPESLLYATRWMLY